ncbi:acetylornithine deacetylase [Candidatus Parcubacteria bacterium]|nr:acetylornithine deacetylase [Candidatus Parcubacteria bacterium]
MKTLNILQSLVAFNSASNKSNLPLIYFIKEILSCNGFKIEIQQFANKANLTAKMGQGKGGLLFAGHTDTVPAGDGWKTDPLKLTKIKEKYYGLGSVDTKGFLAVVISVVCGLTKQKLKKPLTLNFTFDEEVDFSGVKKLLASKKQQPDLAIIGEPTNMAPVIAHKGATALQVDFYGKEAHGSNPGEGINAIELAMQFIFSLKGIIGKKNSIFNPPFSTICISKIKGGTAINKVPGFCRVEMEYRAISKEEQKSILIFIKEKAEQYNGKVKETFSVAPFYSSLSNEKLKEVSNKKQIAVAFCTEAFLYETYGISSMVLGPGDIKRAHKPNEFITESELFQAEKQFRAIIQRFCF